MSPRRRTVLGSLAAVGLGVGYWQRRRIRRWGAIDDLEATVVLSLPTIHEATIVDEGVHDDAHERATERLTELEALIDDGPIVDRHRRRIESAREAVAEPSTHDPPTADAARLDALATYRRQREVIVRRLVEEEPGRWDETALDDRREGLEERLEELAIPYAGEFGDVVVSAAAAEYARDVARVRRSRADEGGTSADAWADVETGTAAVEGAAGIASALAGEDAEGSIEAAFDRLGERLDRVVAPTAADDVPGHPDADVPHAVELQAEVGTTAYDGVSRTLASAAEVAAEGGDLALAVENGALAILLGAAIEPLTEVPASHQWRQLGFELDVDEGELRGRKRAATGAIEDALDRAGDGPLARRLCWPALSLVGAADTTLGRLAADPRAFDAREWAIRRDRAALEYEAARRHAETLPEAVELAVG